VTKEFPAQRIVDCIKTLDVGKDVENFLLYNMPYLAKRWNQQMRLMKQPVSRDVVEIMRNDYRVHNLMDFNNSIKKTDLINVVRNICVCSTHIARVMVNKAIEEDKLREHAIGKKIKMITLIKRQS